MRPGLSAFATTPEVAAAQVRATLISEKSKAQAEARKQVARAEREAEQRLVTQRDEFAKHERTLRERTQPVSEPALPSSAPRPLPLSLALLRVRAELCAPPHPRRLEGPNENKNTALE